MTQEAWPPRSYRWNARLPSIDDSFAILLDGEAIPDKGIVAYDCDGGWIERCLFDANDRKYLNKSGELAAEILRGEISVTPRPS